MARYVQVTTIATNDRSALPALLALAAGEKSDIVCLPEAINATASDNQLVAAAEPLTGPTVQLLSGLARENEMYVWCPIVLTTDRGVTNAAVLLDRQGAIVGRYEKMFPTIGELEMGIAPGTNATVLGTDFGKVGAAICFDANFSELGAELAANGAEIVFFPSMFAAGRLLEHWALQYNFFIVTSYAQHSVIRNNVGRLLTETGRRFETVQSGHIPPLATARLNLDTVVLHLDYNQERVGAIKAKYGGGVELELHQPEGVFILTSHRDDVTVADLITEFGLERRADYYARARRVRASAGGPT